MTDRIPLLLRMLQTLVDEFGFDEVMAALHKDVKVSRRSKGQGLLSRHSSSGSRPSATRQVELCDAVSDQKEALMLLAGRYDSKLFLPSVADVREFLIMMGDRPAGMKDRREAFRVLLSSLVKLPPERLKALVQTALHAGPSELGPLSDAIAAAGERLPRHQQLSNNE